MLISLAMIFLIGMIMGGIFNKIKLPSMLGMLIVGIILSPYAFNLLDDSILSISADLRRIALIIILTHAGLALNIRDLIKIGRPAILMCFVPACFEIAAFIWLSPKLLGVSWLDAAIMGSVLAAVSPAVIVPKMLKLMGGGYGMNKSIPQLIMAGASVDDVFVIVLFTTFMGLDSQGSVTAGSFVQIPISFFCGLLLGVLLGFGLSFFFKKVHIRDSAKVILILSLSFLLVACEDILKDCISISGLLAVMAMGTVIMSNYEILAKRLSAKFSKIWVGAEILLFVLVGSTVDLQYAMSAGLMAILMIILGLLMRMIGVYVCLLRTNLQINERLFCMLGYTPKATVQAAIGAIPLAMGLSCGKIVLTVAVLSILITAPLGAFCIDLTYKKLLVRQNQGLNRSS